MLIKGYAENSNSIIQLFLKGNDFRHQVQFTFYEEYHSENSANREISEI